MSDTPLDLDALERLARAATPGPWRWNDVHELVGPAVEVDYGSGPKRVEPTLIQTDWQVYPPHGADRDYFAAMSPDVILELVARLRRAEAEVAALSGIAGIGPARCWKEYARGPMIDGYRRPFYCERAKDHAGACGYRTWLTWRLSDMADVPDPAEMARLLHVLADRVACGCARVEAIVTTSPDPLTRGVTATLRVSARDCLLADHNRDWR